MPIKTLHFHFGPIQSFISQARRTRDLWAGSYLLSWLSGHAMTAILDKGGEILMPYVEDDKLIKAIRSPKTAEELAKSLGSLPSRFSACIPENQDPDEFANIVKTKWQQVAEAVRDKIDPDRSRIDDAFWNRQIMHHWEFMWVIGDEPKLLDSRKNLRMPRVIEENGEKCTVCNERQELSESKQPDFKPNRKRSKDWWRTLKISNLDLRENERLCAVCLTKRLFPLVAETAIGWKVDRYYPSTAYLSAIDWLEEVLKTAKASESEKVVKAANEFVNQAKGLDLHYSERNTVIPALSNLMKDSGIDKKILDLDGSVFFQEGIDSEEKIKNKAELKKALADLQKAVGSCATPFYAVLLMDGDGMGQLIAECTNEQRKTVSQALAGFTRKVPGIIDQHKGRLVYAGGDDVFALLPVSSAIQCAAECNRAYQEAFAKISLPQNQKPTVSAAVQFSQRNIALSVVVRDAHRLLDDIAKENTGRDALACRVWKPGGVVLTWAQPWHIKQGHQETDFVQLLEHVIKDFHPAKKGDHFSSKFFHKLPGLFELYLDEAGMPDLLLAEYLANREHDWLGADKEKQRLEAQAKIERLLRVCREHKRVCEENSIRIETGKYNSDAALLVRFLVQKEV